MPDDSNPVLKIMAAHQSVRKFLDEPLDQACVQQALRAAQRAATSSNVQAYCLLQIQDASKRERLAELCGGQEQVQQAGGFFIICADQHRHRLLGKTHGRPYQANLETFLLGVIDAGLFAQNLALAFESMALATCFIGGLRNNLQAVDQLLALPEDVLPLFGLCVGKPAPKAERSAQRPRLPLQALLMQDAYLEDEAMLDLIRTYDEELGSWYARRGLPGYDWSGGMTRKFQSTRRAELLAYYASKGAHFR